MLCIRGGFAGVCPHAHLLPPHPRPLPALPPTCPRPMQVALQVMVFAFLVVLLSALLTTPVLLYGLGLAAHGWRWQHGALFRFGGREGGHVSLAIKPTPCFCGRRPACPPRSPPPQRHAGLH